MYMDDLSNILNSAGIGCHIHNCCINHVFYADDICVIARGVDPVLKVGGDVGPIIDLIK